MNRARRALLLAGISFGLGIASLFVLPGLLGPDRLKQGQALYLVVLMQELLLIGLPALLISLRHEQARASFRALWGPVSSYSLGLTSLSAVTFSLAGVLVVSIWISLLMSMGIQVPLEQSLLMPRSAFDYLLAFIGAAALPAFSEELLFRGLLLQALRRCYGDRRAMWFSALLFALIHLSLQGFAVLMVIGIFLAALTIRHNSLWPAVLFHGLYNASAILLNSLKASPTPQMVWLCSGIFIACAYLLFRREPAQAD